MVNPRFRVYASSYKQFKSLGHPNYKTVPENEVLEGHVALAFARDYDSRGKSTHGDFRPYFKITDVTPEDIRRFKNNNSKFKFFLSIGGRSQKYPFSLTIDDVDNAAASLKKIIHNYHFDGIDVYYQHIHPQVQPEQFREVLTQLITRLTSEFHNLEVSITVPPPLHDNYYKPLFDDCQEKIHHVIYQTHSAAEKDRVSNVHQLALKFKGLLYPVDKLFAGYSILDTDWNVVPLPVFRVAVHKLLSDGLVSGLSDWAAICCDDPEK
ncbi:ruBisCO-associated protein-like [Prosopis cineraria]|uniref:ruBisCO-associated protein-like n=1 Tax=Prosopis cineraria TaxID=364024 RepID=UPI0024106461|nr:ruBisCO-associated protein-like [Prosopis cineraria]